MPNKTHKMGILSEHVVRVLMLVLVFPGLILASSPADVILIHAHGEDHIHQHVMSLSDLEQDRHHHGGPADDGWNGPIETAAALGHADTILIIPQTPLKAGDDVSGNARAAARTGLHIRSIVGPAMLDQHASSAPALSTMDTTAPIPCAERTVVGILLSSHAMLL